MSMTFSADDKLERKRFADKLTTAIEKFYPFADGAYVLSLNASFGSGKSTFLEMWAAELTSRNFKVLKIDAWRTDFATDPILPIAEAFLKGLPSESPEGKKLKAALQGAIGAAAFIGNSALEKFSGVDVLKTMKATEADLKASDLLEVGKNIHKAYSHKQNAYDKLLEALTSFVETLTQKPLVVLVDELDRARPNYSVEFLETIKHLFSVKGVCFVLAVDKRQLQASVKKLYGTETDFENYYRRFITVEANLPEINPEKIEPFTAHLFNEYFDEKQSAGIKFGFDPQNREALLKQINICVGGFNLNARKVRIFFRIISHLWAVTEAKYASLQWLRASIFLMALSISDGDLYHKIGAGKATPQDIGERIFGFTLTGHNKKSNLRALILESLAFILTAESLENDSPIRAEVLKVAHKVVGTTLAAHQADADNRTMDMLLHAVGGNAWPSLDDKSGFQRIYESKEAWDSFF